MFHDGEKNVAHDVIDDKDEDEDDDGGRGGIGGGNAVVVTVMVLAANIGGRMRITITRLKVQDSSITRCLTNKAFPHIQLKPEPQSQTSLQPEPKPKTPGLGRQAPG